jgi:hypothetical protein
MRDYIQIQAFKNFLKGILHRTVSQWLKPGETLKGSHTKMTLLLQSADQRRNKLWIG